MTLYDILSSQEWQNSPDYGRKYAIFDFNSQAYFVYGAIVESANLSPEQFDSMSHMCARKYVNGLYVGDAITPSFTNCYVLVIENSLSGFADSSDIFMDCCLSTILPFAENSTFYCVGGYLPPSFSVNGFTDIYAFAVYIYEGFDGASFEGFVFDSNSHFIADSNSCLVCSGGA